MVGSKTLTFALPYALSLAAENAFVHRVRLRPVQTDLLRGVRGPLHVVLANLPYVPLSPRRLRAEARRAGLQPELHAVTYGWRRLPPPVQRAIHPLDAQGSRLLLAPFGHTLMLIARRASRSP